MTLLVSTFLLASCFLGLVFPQTPKVMADDLQPLTGAPWTGTLTYLDYRTNKKVSIPANLLVTPSAEGKQSWVFEYRYPDEPQANSKKIVTIGQDGKTIDGEAVIERTKLPGGVLRIVTEKTGSDNNQPALFRFTYLLGEKSFSVKKEVRYEGKTELFERNQYSWKR